MDKINKTQLDIELATERGLIHRDYIAHCLRWNYALKFIDFNKVILDIGCGTGMLSQVLYVNKCRPKMYVGVDIREKAIEEMMARPANFLKIGQVMDIRKQEYGGTGQFDVVTCFEVVEHFEPKYLDHVLSWIGRILKPGGRLLLSTPNYDGVHKAGNHIHEYTEAELEEAFKENCFVIEKKIGTFASQKDLARVMANQHLELMEQLRGFLDSNLLSVVFASLYPSASRNILWCCHPLVK